MATSGTDLSKAVWRTSTYTNGDNGDCVEVADGLTGVVPVRDSKRPDGGVVMIGAAAWGPFVAALKGC
ncbi:DUF397 domain-containing protein [Streptomyces yangpuensis]|uniref:DUF397 domain-containing protein n=1 Tax=Streptomyces yangpuensis TaxID=1648182 RepID=A0ABY5PYI0_9ACTN|nr:MULTISPECIES: DUF397 domain-containing protein [Streptomyces]UUY48838.1 DUF397 domain-containing protein [Streptomyces yangpuensis]